MKYKKSILTTSIFAILFGTTQANDYLSIISQEKNIYDIIENSIPVSTEWVDKGVEFNCVKEFSAYDYPLGQTFTQNENCLQKQERTVTTTQIFNGTPRTTVKVENQNIPAVISYIETGQENYNTGSQRTQYSVWIDDGIHYDCGDFSPLVSTVNLGESFNQNRSCSQDQTRTETIYDIWADGSETLDSTNPESRTLTELEYNPEIGTKNFTTGAQRTEYTNWINTGLHYACNTFSPLVSTVNLGESFTQNRDCSQDQNRTETVYDIWADTSDTVSSTNVEVQTLIENESQSATGTKNFDTGTNETSYSTWVDNGIHYGCDTFTPATNTIYSNRIFTQTRDCSQNQNRNETIENIWADGTKTIESTTVENRILTEIESQSNTGTLIYSSCKEILDNNKSIGNGTYNINHNSNTISVYCDMERDGGGWTLVRRISDNWYGFSDSLVGTEQLGTYYPDPLHASTFGIVFNNFSYNNLLLTTGDKQKWLITDQDSIENNWDEGTGVCPSQSTVYKSSTNPDGPLQIVGWCKRSSNHEDPWISIESHGSFGRGGRSDDIEHSMLYGENHDSWDYYVSSLNGISIFIR